MLKIHVKQNISCYKKRKYGLRVFKWFKDFSFMEYSNEADDVYKIIEEYVIQIRNRKY